jgi:drug/metabolite transporter (DMT)-like permease
MPRTTHNANFGGVILMLFAVSLLSIMDAGLKQLSLHYPAAQVSALRAIASWPFIAAWALSSVGGQALFAVRWRLHLFRGALGVVTLTLFVYGIRHLPLTTAYTLFFVAPLVIAALSALVLGERVTRARWAIIGIGFAGVLIALRPTADGFFSWPALAVIAGAIGYAVSAITVRVLGRTDSTQAMVFWVLTLMAIGAVALALPQWKSIARADWLLIAGVGFIGALGQFAITEAFRRAEASVIAPIEYTALAWSVGFDALVWKSLPGMSTWIGAAVIVASGIYLVRHTRRASADLAAAQVQP